MSDSFDAIALNGIDSDSFRTKYNFSFEPTEESGSHCVNQMTRFIQIEGSNWFNQTKALSKLDTLDNNSELVSNSYKPLRIKKPN
ncbi:hypothetical protein [Paenibacillus sp. OV219]|uniref:hypothetical protein n=1 Tax=Paenibacillus sp. OV219 TaxID=1884377 RepID=UPI001160378D|nr:hypothetical protein [Paenibacillus sp. OV219]